MLCNRVAPAGRTVGAVLVAIVLTFVWVEAAPASGSAAIGDQMLIPSAGWNGRPIQEPHRHDVVRTATVDRPTRGWSAGPVSFGTGFHRPGGSARVREVQRRLSRLGYHVGPVDGLFGRLTRASIAWFQVKHGLELHGRATLATVLHLRARTGASGSRATGAEPGSATGARLGADLQDDQGAARPEAWEAFNDLVGSRLPVEDVTSARDTGSTSHPALVALIGAALGFLIALLSRQVATSRSDRARAGRSPRDAAPTTDVVRRLARESPDAFAGPAAGDKFDREPPAPAIAEERASRRFASSDDGPPGRVASGGRRGFGARDE